MALIYRLKSDDLDFSFSPTGGPIDDEGPEAKELFEKLGRAAAAWARMEFMLDAILIHINKKDVSAELYDPDHPMGFKRKVDLLTRWLDHPTLAGERELDEKFLDTTKRLSGFRNELLHSHLKSYDAQTKELTLQNVRFTGNDTFRVGEGGKNLEALDVFRDLAIGATLALTEIAARVFQRTD